MDWNTIASFATALGVCVAAWQIWISRKLATIDFEDSFDQQYRELVMGIPVDALIGNTVPSDKKADVRESVFNYLDLCNEQIYLRNRKRISQARWVDWSEGIRNNLRKPVFSAVWDEVKGQVPDEFSYLLRLEENGFSSDPAHWEKFS